VQYDSLGRLERPVYLNLAIRLIFSKVVFVNHPVLEEFLLIYAHPVMVTPAP